MGGLGNRMMQLLAGYGIKECCPDAQLVHPEMDEWQIEAVESKTSNGRSVSFGSQRNRLGVRGLGNCLSRGIIDSVIIDSYAQHFDNFPDIDSARKLFVASEKHNQIKGFGTSELVISIRGREILSGIHPDYVVLPPDFYEAIILETGLKPIFFGEIDGNSYSAALKERFPTANFISGKDAIHDFLVLQRSCHIVPSISTFSWLAAWLSKAKSIHFAVAGLFNPRQAKNHFLVPIKDTRYKFHLFPLAYATNISLNLDRFKVVQNAMAKAMRPISASDLQCIIQSSYYTPRMIDDYLEFYDEDFYRSSYSDVGFAVNNGWLPSALHHYIEHGFREERSCFRLNTSWYSMQYPDAALEVAEGKYFDLEHHYVQSGRRSGYMADEPQKSINAT